MGIKVTDDMGYFDKYNNEIWCLPFICRYNHLVNSVSLFIHPHMFQYKCGNCTSGSTRFDGFLGEHYSIPLFAALFPSNISEVVWGTALISHLIKTCAW